jgi:putative hydrolase
LNDKNESNNGMTPEGFAEFLRQFLEKQGGIDPEQLAKAAGLPSDPSAIASMLQQFQSVLGSSDQNTSGGVNWKVATDQARAIAKNGAFAISQSQRDNVAQALSIGTLWLDAATSFVGVSSEPKLLTREMWVADATGLYQQMSAPVAEQMAAALTETMQQNLPEDMAGLSATAGKFMRSAGGAMFAMQLGQALGNLSGEVLSGGDIGLPIFPERPALVPQNIDAFINDFDIESDQAYIYLTVRELAYARLFKHARWLRDAVILQIAAYASEISIDVEHMKEVSEGLDLNNPEELRTAIDSGAMIAKRTEEQERAVASIETLLALIEGWVEQVTEDATRLLPRSLAVAEAVRRRRADGGPAEKTFGTLVGLQLRPRRLRESVAMWQKVHNELGASKRDSLWSHPDQLPTPEEIDNPAMLIDRIKNGGSSDAMDRALRDLLGE